MPQGDVAVTPGHEMPSQQKSHWQVDEKDQINDVLLVQTSTEMVT